MCTTEELIGLSSYHKWLQFMESTHQHKKKTSFSPNQDLFQLIQIPTQRKEQGQPNSDLKVKEISLWPYQNKIWEKKKTPRIWNGRKTYLGDKLWEKGSNFGKKIQTPRQRKKVWNVRNGRKTKAMLFYWSFCNV